MLKRILVAILLLPGIAWGDNSFQANPDQSTIFAQGQFGAGAVDTKGNVYVQVIGGSTGLSQSVIPLSPNVGYNGGSQSLIGYGSNATDAIEAASTTTVLNLTAHVAQIGDMIRYRTAGANFGAFSPVCAVTTNTVTLCYPLPATPTATDNVSIIKARPIGASGSASTNADGFALNTAISIDTQGGTNNSYILKAEDEAAASGGAGISVFAVRNEGYSSLADANLDYIAPAAYRSGALMVNLDYSALGASDTGVPYALEDGAIANGKALMLAGGVNNRSQAQFNSTQADATPLGVGDYGELTITMSPSAQTFANSAIQAEDAAFGAGSGVVVSGGQAVSAIAQTVGTTGDVAPPSMDLGNRLVTTNAPAGETWYACSAEISSATNTTLKAAVASNRIYVTDWECIPTNTTANSVALTDGAGGTALSWISTVSNAVGTGDQRVFPTPKRLTSNTLLSFTTGTAGGVRCCASGYISTI